MSQTQTYKVEPKLKKMQELKAQLKELEAEYNMLKSDVIENYFLKHQKYTTKKGLLLAEYIVYPKSYFDNKAFKIDHPTLFKNYEDIRDEWRLLLK